CTISSFTEAQMVAGNSNGAPAASTPWKAGTAPCLRMWSSQAASISSVVTPGLAISRMIWWHSAAMRPASDIVSISEGVFKRMRSPRDMLLFHHGAHGEQRQKSPELHE